MPGIKWTDFLVRFKVEKIDLLKMNIEGSEKEILQGINDFSFIKRFVISLHDFMAASGDGEYFRTNEAVSRFSRK